MPSFCPSSFLSFQRFEFPIPFLSSFFPSPVLCFSPLHKSKIIFLHWRHIAVYLLQFCLQGGDVSHGGAEEEEDDAEGFVCGQLGQGSQEWSPLLSCRWSDNELIYRVSEIVSSASWQLKTNQQNSYSYKTFSRRLTLTTKESSIQNMYEYNMVYIQWISGGDSAI